MLGVSRITTLSTPATAVDSQSSLSALSHGSMVMATPPLPTPILFQAHLLLHTASTQSAAAATF